MRLLPLALAALTVLAAPALGKTVALVAPAGSSLDLAFDVEVDSCVPFHCDFILTPTYVADGGAYAGPARIEGDASCSGQFDVAFLSDGVAGTPDARGALRSCEAETYDGYAGHALLWTGATPALLDITAGDCGFTHCRERL